MKHQLLKAAAVVGFAVFALNASADQGIGGMKMTAGTDASKTMAMNEGEVKAVDKENTKITLKHGPIKSKTVEMTPMTMSFPVQDASLLADVKVGDKVKFNIENVKQVATVTSLEVQK